MKLSKDLLHEIFDVAEIDPYDKSGDLPRVRYYYRGRGESHSCFALVGDNKHMAKLLIAVGSVMLAWSENGNDVEIDEKAWSDWKSDRMGHEVIYYWPNIQIQEG